jgi:phospholipase/carboxylesterase
MQQRTLQKAGLDATFIVSEGQAPTRLVVLCHGFGAPGDDLVGLAQAMVQAQAALASCAFVFPHAPLTLSSDFESRAWWMISAQDFADFQGAAAHTARLKAMRQTPPKGLAEARGKLRLFLDAVLADFRLSFSQVLLGGFSQGAMLTTDVALRLEEPVAGLAILSGTMLTDDEWRSKARARAGLAVFQSHGKQDPVLPFAAAQSLHQLFTETQARIAFHPFEGGHGIPPSIVVHLARFATSALGLP